MRVLQYIRMKIWRWTSLQVKSIHIWTGWQVWLLMVAKTHIRAPIVPCIRGYQSTSEQRTMSVVSHSLMTWIQTPVIILFCSLITRRWTSTPQRRRGYLRHFDGLLWLWPLTLDLQNLTKSSMVIPCKFHRDCSSNSRDTVFKFLIPTACCVLDFWPPESNQVISRDKWIFPVSFVQIVLVVHEILW